MVLNLGDSLLKGGESQGFQTVQKGTEGEVASASDLGGISMNEDLLEMEISGEMIEFPLPEGFDQINLDDFHGFQPLIIEIVPIQNVPLFLGLTENKRRQTFAQAS